MRKRSLEELMQANETAMVCLRNEHARLRHLAEEQDLVLRAFRNKELIHFLKTRCKRIVDVNQRRGEDVAVFDNGIEMQCKYPRYVGRDKMWFARMDSSYNGFEPFSSGYVSITTYQSIIADFANVLPEIQQLGGDILPLWYRISVNDTVVESLMTTRVLHWIAPQLPGTWPDIVRDFLVDIIFFE